MVAGSLTAIIFYPLKMCIRDSIDRARRVAEVVSVDEQISIDTGILRIHYKLGLADCFAAELAMRTGAALVLSLIHI